MSGKSVFVDGSGFGFWVLDFGFWVTSMRGFVDKNLGFGVWVLGFGFWVLGFGVRGSPECKAAWMGAASTRELHCFMSPWPLKLTNPHPFVAWSSSSSSLLSLQVLEGPCALI